MFTTWSREELSNTWTPQGKTALTDALTPARKQPALDAAQAPAFLGSSRKGDVMHGAAGAARLG